MTPLPALFSSPARAIMTANIPLTIIIPSAAIGNYSHAAGAIGTVGQNDVDPGGGGGPLATMRQYLSEFDPDTGPVNSPPASQLHSAWMTYVTAFEDLCQV